jgi:hypothetical protein
LPLGSWFSDVRRNIMKSESQSRVFCLYVSGSYVLHLAALDDTSGAAPRHGDLHGPITTWDGAFLPKQEHERPHPCFAARAMPFDDNQWHQDAERGVCEPECQQTPAQWSVETVVSTDGYYAKLIMLAVGRLIRQVGARRGYWMGT